MLFKLPPLNPAIFIKRKNRFCAEVDYDKNIIPLHLANSGRMSEILNPGTIVWWHPKESGKTKGSLWALENNGIFIILHAVAANMIFEAALTQKKIPSLKNIQIIKKEFTYNNSRFDFLLKNTITGKKILAEVKSVNLCINHQGIFPDAPTLRGKKHLEELLEAKQDGYDSWVVFVGLRDDIQMISPNWQTDPGFSETLKTASVKGVEILSFSSSWNQTGCFDIKPIPFAFEK